MLQKYEEKYYKNCLNIIIKVLVPIQYYTNATDNNVRVKER